MLRSVRDREDVKDHAGGTIITNPDLGFQEFHGTLNELPVHVEAALLSFCAFR